MKHLKVFEKFSPELSKFEVTLIDLFDIYIDDARKLSELYDEVMEEDDLDERMNIIDGALIGLDLEERYPEVWNDLEEYIKNRALE